MLLFESFVGVWSQIPIVGIINSLGPCNVVLAGQYLNLFRGRQHIPYCNLFRRTEFLEVEDYGRFEAYSNRDSLYRCIWFR
jgi:hypothetical protein